MDAMISSLSSELKIFSYHCFTDSQVALCWIRNVEKSWKPFVQNRVSEIRSLLPVECWKHIPGVENPADIPSRGAAPLDLLVNKLWQEGPKVPLERIIVEQQADADVPPECLEELRPSEKRVIHGLLASEVVGIRSLVEVKDFSSLSRLVNTVTLVLKFCSLLRQKTSSTATFHGDERRFAESLLIREAHNSLKSHKNFLMWEKQLSIFTDDDGILRCCGRISNAPSLPYSTKHPVILPGGDNLTTLYVRRAHARVLHNGVRKPLLN